MLIRCWGSRGSIPVSGPSVVKYGGDTTCMEIRAESGEIIIVDAGTGIRRLGNFLLEEESYEYHVIFTHAHWDHVMGFPFFKPIFHDNVRLYMHKCPFHSKFVETILTKVMSPPYFPVPYADIRADIWYEDACPYEFQIGSVQIEPIPLSHPNSGSGYKFTEKDKQFVFLTDNELGYVHPNGLKKEEYLAFSRGADLLIHDAEYTPEEYQKTIQWGHTVYPEALELAMEAGVKHFGLFHINQERTDDQLDAIVEDCQRQIRERHVPMECSAVSCDSVFQL